MWNFTSVRKKWYIYPCVCDYRTFKGAMAPTGVKRMSSTVKFKHHAIAIFKLTPADRILEAACQLDGAIKQQPNQAQMVNITTIEVLRTVLLGEKTQKFPPNSVQL